jgi:hypothetical protein
MRLVNIRLTKFDILQETALNHVKTAGLLGDGFGATPEMSKRNLIWPLGRQQNSASCRAISFMVLFCKPYLLMSFPGTSLISSLPVQIHNCSNSCAFFMVVVFFSRRKVLFFVTFW